MAIYGIEPTEAEEQSLIAGFAGMYAGSTPSTEAIDWRDNTTGEAVDLSKLGLSEADAAWYKEQAPRYYEGDVTDAPDFGAYWNLYGDPEDTTAFWETQAGVDWLKNARSGGDAERDRQAAADDDGFGDILSVLTIAALVYTGGAAAGWWGAAEGAAAAGAAGAAEAAGGAMTLGDASLGALVDTTGAAAAGATGGAFLGAGVDPVVAADAAAGTPMFGGTAAPFMGAGVDPVVGADAAAGTPMFGGEAPFMGAGVDPVVAADAAQGTPLVSTGAPVGGGLVDKVINWAGKEIGKGLLNEVLTPDAPAVPAAPGAAPKPFSFFGDLPWKSKAATGAPGLTRLSTGKSVFGSGGLSSPGIVGSRLGRG